MTREEMSNAFDTLYNNINSNQAPSLTEYEKSVFLTKALQYIIEDYFSPKRNKLQEGMEDSPNRQFDLSNIIVQFKSIPLSSSQNPLEYPTALIDKRSRVFRFPKDPLFILDEEAKATIDLSERRLSVMPISYDTYMVLMSKPYKYPAKKQAWRLQNTYLPSLLSSMTYPVCELISAYALGSYIVRYVRKPRPIILIDFSGDGLTIQGCNGDQAHDQTVWQAIAGSSYVLSYDQASELDPLMHNVIVLKAVELAKASISGDVNSHVAVGSFSETLSGFPMSKNNK